MYVSSVAVTDYSTGTEYKYGDQSGDWTSIESVGGKVNGNVGGALADSSSPSSASPSGTIQPFYQPSASATMTYTTYPGLQSGWSVNPTTGKVIPPSSAPVSKHPPVRTYNAELHANDFTVQVPTNLVWVIACSLAGSWLLGMRI
jgi:hypothetical protein